jgi:hypothetical protein
MAHANLSERGLTMQGFPIRQDPSIQQIEPWLRLTPSLSTIWITSGTALSSPLALLGFSLVSAIGASQKNHPFDQLYNLGIRRVVKGKPLPENPPPRRFAMALAAAWAAVAAGLMLTGRRRAGTATGALLAISGATVATTHLCLGSLVYQRLQRFKNVEKEILANEALVI